MNTYLILGCESFATNITSMRSIVCVDSFTTYQHIWFLKYLETKCTLKMPVICAIISGLHQCEFLYIRRCLRVNLAVHKYQKFVFTFSAWNVTKFLWYSKECSWFNWTNLNPIRLQARIEYIYHARSNKKIYSYTLWTNKRPLETTIPNEWPCWVTQEYEGKNKIKVDEVISINKNSKNHKIQFIKQCLTQLFFSWPMNHSAQKLFT